MNAANPPGIHAVITCGAFHMALEPGQAMSFGRGHGHTLRIGYEPLDLRIPRSAGRLECREDGILIHNLSDKRSLVLQTFPGPQYEIQPLMITGTHPHDQTRLLLTGNSATFVIAIDTRPLQPSGEVRAGPPFPVEDVPTAGFDRISTMSRRHRILLSGLCLPLLTRSGEAAQVPTYAEISEILTRYGHTMAASTIRNGLDDLRSWLTHEHDVPGLLRDPTATDASSRNENLVRELALWAILSGNVIDEDLDSLERDDTEGES